MNQPQALFAKQPIFDAALCVAAYELLFRGQDQQQAEFDNGDQATSHVLLHAFGQHAVADIIGDVPAFINFTRNLLVFPPPLPPQKLVVEVLENIHPDQFVLDGLKSLKHQGYKIALDDFFLTAHSEPLLAYADIVKVDVLATQGQALTDLLARLKPTGVTLLAEKIETYEMLEHCKALGFELFQGYFLSRPALVTGHKPAMDHSATLQLMRTICSPQVNHKTLASALATEPNLNSRLLKVLNTRSLWPGTGNDGPFTSISDALQALGTPHVQRIVLPLLLAKGSGNNKPAELCMLGLARAEFCARAGAAIYGQTTADLCFTVGALSTFDALLDMPINELATLLSLPQNIALGLTTTDSPAGTVLNLCRTFETADWQKIDELLSQDEFKALSEAVLNELYADALSWARAVFARL